MKNKPEAQQLGYASAYSSTGQFGLHDYINMFKARGWRLPLTYLIEAHLFDLIHGTDTHHWHTKENFPEQPQNFPHGGLYMCNWTREVKQAFRFMQEYLTDDFEKHQFIDVGCGKGKVALIWKQLLDKIDSTQPVVGIDYIPRFIEITKRNQQILFGRNDNILFEAADATSYD